MSHIRVPGTICLRTRVQITTKTNRHQPLILGNLTWEHTENIIFLAFSNRVADRWGGRWTDASLSRHVYTLLAAGGESPHFTNTSHHPHHYKLVMQFHQTDSFHSIKAQYMQRMTEQQQLSLISLIFCSSLAQLKILLYYWALFLGSKDSAVIAAKVPIFPDRKREHKQRINTDATSCYFEMEIIHSWLLLCHTDLSLASHVCKAIYHDITALQISYMRVIHHLFQLLPSNKSV